MGTMENWLPINWQWGEGRVCKRELATVEGTYKANARNVSFTISLRWPGHFIKPTDQSIFYKEIVFFN